MKTFLPTRTDDALRKRTIIHFCVYLTLAVTGALVINLLLASSALGQTTDVKKWQAKYNGLRGSAESKVVKVDGQGNVLVSGSSIDPDGNPDLTTIKYEGATGRQLWQAHQIGEKGAKIYDMALDVTGNVYMVATKTYESNPGTIDPKTGQYIEPMGKDSLAGNILTLTKYNGKTGQLLWQAEYDKYYWGDTEQEGYAALALDGAGNAFITGAIQPRGYNALPQQAVLKYDAKTGQLLWQVIDSGIQTGKALILDGAGYVYVLGSGSEYEPTKHVLTKYGTGAGKLWWQKEHTIRDFYVDFRSLAVDSKKNVYVGGQILSFASVKRTEQVGQERVEYAAGKSNLILFKYASSGNLLWQKQEPAGLWIGDAPATYVPDKMALGVDKADNVYMASREVSSATEGGYVIRKYAGTSGNSLWGQAYRIQANQFNSHFQAMVVDAENNVSITGTIQSLDSQTGNLSGGIKGYTTMKYDGAGRQLWQTRYESNRDSQVQAIAASAQGHIFVSGTNTNHGSAIVTLKYDRMYGDGHEFTTRAKIASDDNDISAAEPFQLKAYPVPSQDNLHVSFMADADSEVFLTLYTLAGKPISKYSKSTAAGEATLTIPVQHLPNGMYILMLTQGTHTMSKKVIISH